MRHVLAIISSTLVLLVAIVALRVAFVHRTAPLNSGLQGALRAAPLDVLLVGSSHARQGYDVQKLERDTGLSAFVVAYNGLDYVWMLPVVSELLSDPARRPRILVVEGWGMSLAGWPEIQDTRLFLDAPPRLKAMLLRRYLAGGVTYRNLADLFDLVVNRGNDLALMFPVQARLTSRLSYHGGYTNKVVPGLTEFPTRLWKPTGDEPSRDQVEALIAIIDLARRAGVLVVSIETPMTAPLERQPVVQHLKSSLRAILAQHEVPYLDGATVMPVDEPRYFGDSHHLSTEGRAVFTAESALFIARTAGSTRLVRTARP